MQKGYLELVEYLIDTCGVPVTLTTSSSKTTALQCAAVGSPFEIVEYLLGKGAIEYIDSSGSSTLHYACQGRNTRIVALLLKKEYCAEICDNAGANLLHIAVDNNDGDMLTCLSEKLGEDCFMKLANQANKKGKKPGDYTICKKYMYHVKPYQIK